jgi:hypothetical protein
MPENVDIILEHLRGMRNDITALRDDTREVKSLLTSLESAVSAMRREIADLYTDVVGQQRTTARHATLRTIGTRKTEL